MKRITWLALGYNVPAQPSKNRVYVWRKLKEYGAEYFRPGVAILPDNPESMARLRTLAIKIKDMGGESVIVELRFCDRADEAETVERFRSHSREEYTELMRIGRKVIGANGQLSAQGGRADRDEQLRKLVKSYGKVKSRDYFSSRDSVSQGLADLADDMERVAAGLGRQLKNLLFE